MVIWRDPPDSNLLTFQWDLDINILRKQSHRMQLKQNIFALKSFTKNYLFKSYLKVFWRFPGVQQTKMG